MAQSACANCDAPLEVLPCLVDGAWYALCKECLFETEFELVEAAAEDAPDFRVM